MEGFWRVWVRLNRRALFIEGGSVLLNRDLRPRELHRFQGLYRFSPNPNIYNNLGNLLSLKQQPQWFE